MSIAETLTYVLVFLLGIVAAGAAIIGMLGAFGALRFARCERCDRLQIVAARDAQKPCVYCAHDRLFHPLHAMHVSRAHAPRH